MTHDTPNEFMTVVPLFPLPNVVLFPRAVLPLHIFEERYKSMTADALRGERRIAMALLKPGWEKDYHGGRAAIEPVVCVGEILSHELLPEGTYTFLLRGQHRARIVREIPGRAYRQAEVAILQDSALVPVELSDERDQLIALLGKAEMSRMPGIDQFRELAQGLIPVQDLADLLAFHMLEEIPLKQALLSETDAQNRVLATIQALDLLRATLPTARPRVSGNPSMN